MSIRISQIGITALLSFAAIGAAHAEHHEGGHGTVVPQGKLSINAPIGINLSADNVADPIAIAPDVLYGAADKLDVGLYHSAYGITGFWSQTGGGICIGDNCGDDAYDGPVGLLARYELMSGKASLAANGGLAFSNVLGDGDMLMSLKAGVDFRYGINEQLSIVANPNLLIGVTNRETDVGGVSITTNPDILNIPVAVMYSLDAKTHLGLQTGVSGALDNFGDSNRIPLALGGMYQVDEKLGVGGNFGFLNIAGEGSSADFRNLTLFAKYNL